MIDQSQRLYQNEEQPTDDNITYFYQNNQQRQSSNCFTSLGRIIGSIFLYVISILLIIYLYQNIGKIFANFFSESQHELILAGDINYAQIPHQYWEHRILMAKSLGLNTLTVYVLWNYHEISPRIFNFQTGNRNLTKFLELAKLHQMKIFLAPGPYSTENWDLGGIPSRFYSNVTTYIRNPDIFFLEETKIYFTQLTKIINPYLWSQSKKDSFQPIKMVKLQHNYGSFNNKQGYITLIKLYWMLSGVNTRFYYSDYYNQLKYSDWQGANLGIIEGKYYNLNYLRLMIPDSEIFIEGFLHFDTTLIKQLLCFNYGFSLGLIYESPSAIHPNNFLIDIQGRATNNFYKLKKLIAQNTDIQIEQSMPPIIKAIQFLPFTPIKFNNLLENLQIFPQIKRQQIIPHFESNLLELYQSSIAVYQTHLDEGQYQINVTIKDYGFFIMNNKIIQQLNQTDSLYQIYIKANQKVNKILILVEGLTHISESKQIQIDYKGLIKFEVSPMKNNKFINLDLHYHWNIYTINLQTPQLFLKGNNNTQKNSFPSLFKSMIILEDVGDTFLNLQNYSRGYVWVNKHKIGRYSKEDRLIKLFCPGVYLKKGQNEIVILDLLVSEGKIITSSQH